MADREVVLVRATPEFEAAWKQAIQEFMAAYYPAKVAYDEASQRQRTAWQIYLNNILDSYSNQTHKEAKLAEEAALKHVGEVAKTWRDHALKLIVWGQDRATRTDANGRYQFSSVSPGRYYIFARAEVPVMLVNLTPMTLHWWVPVEIKSGIQTVDLTMSNKGDWPFVTIE